MEPQSEFDWNPYSIPQDVLAAIGLATACFAQSEEMLQHAIAGCCGIDIEYGLAVTTHMSMPLRFDVLKATAEIRIDDLDALDELDTLLDEFEVAIKKRNAIVHRRWCVDHKTGNTFTSSFSARGSVTTKLEPASVEQVLADAKFIYEIGMKLFVFLKRLDLVAPIVERPSRHHKSKAARKKRRKKGL